MTTNDQDLTQVSFHEATVVGLFRNGSTVTLTLDDVYIAGVQRPAKVVIEGVSVTLRDGSPVDGLHTVSYTHLDVYKRQIPLHHAGYRHPFAPEICARRQSGAW